MARFTANQQAQKIINDAAGTAHYDVLRAMREFFNSDTVFVEWFKKTDGDVKAVNAARLIQKVWKTFGIARAIFITLKALKAALLKMKKDGVKITKKVALEVFELLTRKKATIKEKAVIASFAQAEQASIFS